MRIWMAEEFTFLRTRPDHKCLDCNLQFDPLVNNRAFRYSMRYESAVRPNTFFRRIVYFCPKCYNKRLSKYKIKLPQKELRYIAGILDASGNISIVERTPNSRQPYINVVDKCKALVQHLCDKLGTNEVPLEIPSVSEWKVSFNSIPKCLEIAKTLKPFMKFKVKHMELMEEFCSLVIKRHRTRRIGKKSPYPREKQIYSELKRLNTRPYPFP